MFLIVLFECFVCLYVLNGVVICYLYVDVPLLVLFISLFRCVTSTVAFDVCGLLFGVWFRCIVLCLFF